MMGIGLGVKEEDRGWKRGWVVNMMIVVCD